MPGLTAAVSSAYDPAAVFEFKYEFNSWAAFLQLSADYRNPTGGAAFFSRNGSAAGFGWLAAAGAVLGFAETMRDTSVYTADVSVSLSPCRSWCDTTDERRGHAG